MAPTQPQGDSGLDKKSSSNDKKTPDRRLVQLNLKSVPASIKNSVVSEKSAAKKTKRNSSTDCDSPNGPPDLDTTGDIRLIHEGIADIKNTMVRKTDVKEIVTSIISELKSEIKSEILAEVKATIMPELTQSVTDKIKTEFNDKIDTKTKEFEHQTKEISDGFQLEFETLREKFSTQAKELRELKQNLKECQHVADAAVVLANNNQQYSQKSNIKFTNWQESEHENLRSDLCRILKETVNIDLDASDVLAIHRVPGGNRGGPRPVIAKFRDTDTKIKVIKNRSKDEIKKRFVMHDHLTQMNAQLIKTLNLDERIKGAWYYNGKVFAEDHGGKRHRFDILDKVSDKVKHRHEEQRSSFSNR